MRITTLVKKYFFNLVTVAFLFGFSNVAFSQCPTVTNVSQTFCDTQSPTVANLQATDNGGGVVWYATATSTIALSSSAPLQNGEDYFADDNTGTCGTRQSVVVTIYSAPIADPFQGPCVENLSDATLQDFTAIGNNIQWYAASTGGSPLPITTVIVNGTLYYASQTNPFTGCETSRRAVRAVVGYVPTPTGNPTQNFCNVAGNPPTVASLNASGDNNWYLNSFSGVPLSTATPLINGHTYYATTIDPPCESVNRLAVLVNIYEPNNAGTNGNLSLCQNLVSTTAPVDLFTLLGGTPDNTGVWTGPIATTNGAQGTLDVTTMTLAGSPYTFTYTVSNPACPVVTSTVTISILPLATATVSVSPTVICANSIATLTFTGTPNATVTYTINNGASQTVVLNASGAATVSSSFAATSTIDITNVASATTPSCDNNQVSSTTVTVIPLPDATVAFNPATICANTSSTLTFTGTANATVTYTINSGPNQTIVLNASGTATLVGTYTVNTTVTLVSITTAGLPSCTKALNQTITLTVLDPTATVAFAPTTICANTSSTLTFIGTANATVTYTINSGANQTIVLDATGTATLVGTYTANTTVTLVSVTTAGLPSCTKALNQTITLTVLDPTATVAFAPTTICANTSSTLTFTGTANATVTYTINSGTNQTVVLNASGTATVVGTYTVNTTVTLVSVTTAGLPSCTKALNQTVTLTVIDPTASAAFNPTTICANTSSTLTFTGTANATVTYTINSGANQTIVLDATGTATLVGTYTANTTVTLVSVTTAGLPSCTKALNQTITLTIIDPTATVAFAPTTICANTSSTLTFTGTANATVTYTINSGANQTVVLNASGTATVVGTYTTNTTVTLVSVTTAGLPSCTKLLTQSVTLTVLDPTATVAFNPTTICANTSSTLTFTGTANATVTYTINSGANQTVVLNASGTATVVGTYTVNTTVTLVSVTTAGLPSCTKALNQTVTLTVIDPTASAAFNPTTICANTSSTVTFTGTANATVTYTINSGANQTIVLDATGTATLVGTYTANTTVTLVSVTTAGLPSCTKALNQTITLTIIDPTATVAFAPTTICANTSSTLTFTGTANATVTYTINSGASQTVVLNASGTATVVGTYTTNTTVTLVSVTTAGLPSCTKLLTQSVTLTVLDPTATVAFAPTTICANTSSTLTFTGTANATVTYTINSGANQTVVLNASGTATVVGTYTVNTTVTLVSVTTAGLPSCTKALNQTVTLTVIDPTASAAFNPTTICANTSSTVTFTGTANATVTYTINSGANQTIVLDATGTATLVGTYTANTTVTLVSVTTAGLPSCTKALNQTITLTIIDPTATVAFAPTTICANTSSTLTFTGTANATVTYTINSGANQTVVLNASGTATVVGTYTTNTTVTLVSVTTAGLPSCTKVLTQSVTLTVLDPTATVAFNPTTICANTSSTLTFTGTANATVTYTINSGANQTVVLNASGTATVVGTYTVNTTVTLVSVTTAGLPSCTKALNQTVTLTVIDPTASAAFNPTTICANTSSTLTFTGTANATVTYTINSGANQTIVLDAAGTATLVGSYAANTTVTLVSVATSASPSCIKLLNQTITLTIIDPTATATFAATPVCSNTSAVLTFTGTPNATVTYTVNSGANQTIVLNGAGTATLTATYTSNTTITLVSVTTAGAPGCTKLLNQVINLTVNIQPIAGVNPSPVTVCFSSAPFDLFALLGPTAQAGGTWSPALASGTNIFNPAVDLSNTYVYTVTGVAPCTPATASVQVSVSPVPNAGDDINYPICSNQDPVDLFTLLGPNAQAGGTWLPALASGTGVLNPAVDAATTYIYTVAGIAPCADDTASVNVTITPGPEAGVPTSETLCVNSPTFDLFAALGPTAQPGGTWTNPANAVVTNILDPSVDIAGIYTYTLTGANPCDNDVATVTITINPVPDAGDNSSKVFCSNDAPTDLFLSLGGTPQTGGTWSPALASGTGVFNPAVDTAQVYTYTVGATLCTPDSAQVDVSIIQAPNAGGAGQTLNTCVDVTSFDLTNGLDGSQDAGTWNDDDATGALTGNLFNPSAVGAGTYHFTYTVIGTSPCVNGTSVVTVMVNPLPNAGTVTTMSPVCSSVGTVELNMLLTGQDLGGIWTDSAAQVVTSPINISTFLGGIYSYTYTVTNFCGTATQTVQFEVLPNPIIASANVSAAAVCVGSDVNVTLTGIMDGTYALNYDLSGSNVAAGQSATVTVTGGTANFTIPIATIPNSGTTTISFTNIQNTSTTCQVALTTVSTTIVINPAVQLDNANITVAEFCLGTAATVSINNAANLPDGDYQFDYTIPTGTPTTGNSGNVTIVGGNGTFTIPASVFATTGNYAITINTIITATGCSNLNEDATTTFNVITIPNAGTVVSISPVCPSVGSIDLNTLLTGQDAGGVWTDSAAQIVSSPINISAFLGGIYSYTYTLTNACGTVSQTVQFEVLPNPLLDATNISAAPVCIGTDAVVNLSGMIDGTYTLNYDLSGSNVVTGQTVTVSVSGGVASFTIPTATVPNSGTTTITFTNIQNTTSNCQVALTTVSAALVINPIVQLDNANITVANLCLGNAAIVTITNAVNLPDGDYQFNYTIPTGTPTTGNSGNVTMVGGSGSFTIPATVVAATGPYTITINNIIAAAGCSNANEDATTSFAVLTTPNAGTFNGLTSICTSTVIVDLASLVTGEEAGGVWTDSANQIVNSPINILTFTAGTYTYTYTVTNICGVDTEVVQFTVLPSATLTSLNLTAPSICIGNNGEVNFNGMVDGTYTLDYDLGGSNPLAAQQVVVTITGGTGSFTIPSTVLTNTGITIISFTKITNNGNSCFSLLNVATSLLINPLANIDTANLSATNVCAGNDVIVNITNATGLVDGNYQFNYTIAGATPTTGTTAVVPVISGVGQFTLAAALFTTTGAQTITVNGIVASAGGCTNNNENASVNVTIYPIPAFTGASLAVQATCPNFDSTATISGATSLSDGTYTIAYNLSGANTANAVATSVTITAGVGTFTIPAASITAGGTTAISITDLTSTTTGCGGTVTSTLDANFEVTSLTPPTLITDGDIFCDTDNPTVANLTLNIVGGQTVIWYNAPTGGTALASTDVLVNGTTYYAAAVAPSGCESLTRLQVIANIKNCHEIKIPDGFSPNNDGINDTFVIGNLVELYPLFTLEIYNRYGNKVYQGNSNTPNWDGTSSEGGLKLGDSLLPTGVYFFIINFNDGIREPLQDRVYLSR